MALVHGSARKVLDIGCGTGRLGEALKARQQAEVIGIEFDEAAATVAQPRLDGVIAGDAEQAVPDFPPASFDAIVCADIPEHLRVPGALLRKARSRLAPDGRLVASIPNVRHNSVVRSLLEANWTYEPAGLLDRTHLRLPRRPGQAGRWLILGAQVDSRIGVFYDEFRSIQPRQEPGARIRGPDCGLSADWEPGGSVAWRLS